MYINLLGLFKAERENMAIIYFMWGQKVMDDDIVIIYIISVE